VSEQSASPISPPLFPAFLKLAGRPALLVGGGTVAASKLGALLDAGARVTVVAPDIGQPLVRPGVRLLPRAFAPADLDGQWLAVAAATPEVNREVSAAAEVRRVFVNAVDDAGAASAYLGGVVRKGGVTLAVSTEGRAPALAGLLREALEALLPDELPDWMRAAESLRAGHKRDGVPLSERRPLLLRALTDLYAARGGR
jgi:uroporphyrin-III C-methyltransferase/precorrin-2 dehydrogenase/sirohydrochlorin ferrochelatase